MVAMEKAKLTVKLQAVTVFSDRAQLSYLATTDAPLQPGMHTLAVDSAAGWEHMDPDTVQVQLDAASADHGRLVLRNVGFVTRSFTEDTRAEVQTLTVELRAVLDRLQTVQDEIAIKEESLQYVKRLEDMLRDVSDETPLPPPQQQQQQGVAAAQKYLTDPTQWAALGEFIADTMRTSSTALLTLREEQTQLEAERRRLEGRLGVYPGMPLDELSHVRVHERRTIEITVQVLRPDEGAADNSAAEALAEVHLRLSFVVHGAHWKPLYDLRVQTASDAMEVSYYAEVRQSTGLDWDKVRLRLSTASPHFGATPPSFPGRWNITLRPPQPVMTRSYRHHMRLAASAGASNDALRPHMLGAVAFAAMPRAAMVAPDVEEAVVEGDAARHDNEDSTSASRVGGGEAGSTASVFNIPGLATVRSDNKAVRVTIMRKSWPVKLHYLAVPKIDPLVYALAKATNASEFELLPGQTSVFYDNTFANRAKMELVPPGADFTVSLGADEGVKVVRKRTRRVEGDVGTFFNTRSSVQYAYVLTVESRQAKAAVDVVLRDQYPISSDKELEVELLEPSAEERAQGRMVSVSELGEVEWRLRLRPNEKRTVRLAFRAQYPKEKEVPELFD